MSRIPRISSTSQISATSSSCWFGPADRWHFGGVLGCSELIQPPDLEIFRVREERSPCSIFTSRPCWTGSHRFRMISSLLSHSCAVLITARSMKAVITHLCSLRQSDKAIALASLWLPCKWSCVPLCARVLVHIPVAWSVSRPISCSF